MTQFFTILLIKVGTSGSHTIYQCVLPHLTGVYFGGGGGVKLVVNRIELTMGKGKA